MERAARFRGAERGTRSLVACALALALSASGAAGAALARDLSVTSVLTTADNGKRIALRVGAEATLRLPENPSTGYRWAVEAADSHLVEVTQSDYAPASNAPGSGGETQWTIKAKAPGSTTVTLKRWRPWEGDKSVVERYGVTIDVSS
jgi:inhibitor of cysteine peptidase